jgi:H+/Cl- antiporter ClcA/CBS domain-containing protein
MTSSARPVPPRRPLADFNADRRLLLLVAMALVVGLGGTAAAWLLIKLITLVTNLVWFGRLDTVIRSMADVARTPWMVVAPMLGGLVIGLMARFGSEKIRGHGIPEAIEAILIGGSRMSAKVAVLKPISSAISIGTGGPFGAEGPIIMTGGAIGSLFAQFFHLSAAERKTLLVAGAAAGMTATFGTPVAAMLLAVELLLFEWKPRSFIPVGIAAVVAAAWRPWLLGAGPLFPYTGVPVMEWWGLGLCAAVGVAAGLQSALMTVCLYGVEDLFRKLPIHWMWWPALGGLVVGIGGYLDPAVLGVGYANIRDLLNGTMDMHAAISLLIGKSVVWIVALSSGTSGGVLAPLLMMGGALGALEAHFLPFGDAGFWALIGMAAILGGTMRAPLTATMFAFELTDNIHVLPALFIASLAAFLATVLLMRRSILTERIARRGLHLTREYTVDPFEIMRVADIMAKPVDTMPVTMTVTDAVGFFSLDAAAPRHKSYPVVDADGKLAGIVSRADVFRWTRDGWNEGLTLADACDADNLVTAYADELVGRLADRMAESDKGRVPVVDRATGKLVGLVARRDLLRVRAAAGREEFERERAFKLFG